MVQVLAKEKRAAKNKNIFEDCKFPHPLLKVCVVLPAKNEEETIESTLMALKGQLLNNGSPLSFHMYEVLLLANNCTDGTYQTAKAFAARHPSFNLHVIEIQLPRPNANIGYVRRILMDEACRRLCLNGQQNGIIASTDGDTLVDSYWLANILDEIGRGCDAVGGRILTNSINPQARLYYLRDIAYRLLLAKAAAIIDPQKDNPWPCHHQYFGASLAVTCSMYNHCGRMPGVPHLEDMALYNALIKVDAKIRCSPTVKVYTSGRTDGRVAIGFSEQLKKWARQNKSHAPQMVEPASSLLIKCQCKKLLRKCLETYKDKMVIERKLVAFIADTLLINKRPLRKAIISATYFGELWQQTEAAISNGNFYDNHKAVEITEAIFELRKFLSGC